MRNFIRIILSYLLFIVVSSVAYAQLRYPIVGSYKGKSAQGMAIWKDKAYLFNDGGHCRVLDLKTEDVIQEFDLESSDTNTHVNAACFGNEFFENNELPVIYISEYKTPSRCFVESFGPTGSILVQTIQAQENEKNIFVQSWIPDQQNNYLYTIARQTPKNGEKNSSIIKITKYRLPKLSEGKDVILSEKDIKDEFYVDFSSGTQGGIIKDNYLYLPTGLQESAKGAFNAKRILQVIDLKKKELVFQINLTYLTTNEPEDIDFYCGKVLLYCGQQGGIYEISGLGEIRNSNE